MLIKGYALLVVGALVLGGCTAPQAATPAAPTEEPTEPMMCCGHEETLSREVVAFADLDEDGAQDADEPPIPDVLIMAIANIHGGHDRERHITDADGRARIEMSYTHFFWIDAAAPCGYDATTPTSVDVPHSDETIQFGFAPRDPQMGAATVKFRFWQDENANGVQDGDEPPLPLVNFWVTPVSPEQRSFSEHAMFAFDPESSGDAFALTTDGEGRAEIDLGNSCGVLRVWEPRQYNPLTQWRVTDGAAQVEADDSGFESRMVIEYGIGETLIEWGMWPQE